MTDTDASDAGRALAARRKREWFVCERCATRFEATVKRDRENRFCGPACRNKQWRQEQKAARAT